MRLHNVKVYSHAMATQRMQVGYIPREVFAKDRKKSNILIAFLGLLAGYSSEGTDFPKEFCFRRMLVARVLPMSMDGKSRSSLL